MIKKKKPQEGYIFSGSMNKGTSYTEKKEGRTLLGGRKSKYYLGGKKVAVARSRGEKSKVKIL